MANRLDVDQDRLTGRLVGPVIDGLAKRNAVISLCDHLSCSTRQAIVVGDGANDLQMMSAAGVSIAFRAKPIVRSETTRSLSFSGLEAIVNLFG